MQSLRALRIYLSLRNKNFMPPRVPMYQINN
jgi:hypothetical protein